jgi:uncharacterized protein (TIGR03084 family)
VSGVDLRPTTLPVLLEDLEAERGELDALVAALGESDWDRATPADGWAVRDQISHLAYFDEAALLAMTDSAAFKTLVDAMLEASDPMQEHLRRGRAMSGAELLTWWRSRHADMVEATGGLPDGARVPWFGPPMGALSFVSARLMETWAHGQDVADTFGTVRVPTSRLRHIAHLGVRTRSFSYAVRALEPPPTPVRVALIGPGDEMWEWNESEVTDNRVEGPALDFCLVVTQRRNVADTDLIVTGDTAHEWMGIAQAFAGPPGPGRPSGLRR